MFRTAKIVCNPECSFAFISNEHFKAIYFVLSLSVYFTRIQDDRMICINEELVLILFQKLYFVRILYHASSRHVATYLGLEISEHTVNLTAPSSGYVQIFPPSYQYLEID